MVSSEKARLEDSAPDCICTMTPVGDMLTEVKFIPFEQIVYWRILR